MTAVAGADGSASTATRPLLELEGLTVEFLTESGWTRVVDDVSFQVGASETVGLVGESGSGKTVTSTTIMGLLPKGQGRVAGGRIMFNGRDLTSLRRREMEDLRGDRVAMIFQEPMTSLNPAFTVGDQIAETIRRHRGLSRREAARRAVTMLSTVGIPNAGRRAASYPHEFSGGMRQRVMIAMALSCEPALLIADEPTTALDVTIQAQILDLLREMRAQFQMSVLFVTHDLGVVADICDRVVVMYAGQVVEQGDVVDIFHHPTHPYTEGLLRSMPLALGVHDGDLHSIPGQPPVPGSYPSGCRFHPRCDYAVDACRDHPVELVPTRLDQSSRCIRTAELELGRRHG